MRRNGARRGEASTGAAARASCAWWWPPPAAARPLSRLGLLARPRVRGVVDGDGVSLVS